MPRQARKESGTGIYHVMLRGINRQDIFEEEEDYMRMLSCLQQMLEQYDDQGNRLPPLCTFYAYCLMSNHVHLLLRVNQEDIGSTIKHLAVMYAIYYNQKYSRSGHVFQDRFKSEPVNDMAYFVTLLRYIHQNPTKAGIVGKVGEELFFDYSKETGAKVLVYRFPNLFGKWCRPNYNSAVATFCNAFANDLPYTVNDPSVELELLSLNTGQVSINISKPGITKGQHWHNTKFEQFIVVKGHGLILQRNLNDPDGKVLEWEVSGDKIEAVHMLPGYTHNIINLSDTEDLVTVMYCNEVFNPYKPDTFFEKV